MAGKPPLAHEEVQRILRLLEPLSADRSIVRVRAVLRLNERVFRKCMHDIHFRAAVRDLGVDPFAAVLGEHRALPEKFRATRYPQMCAQIEARRAAQLRAAR